MTKDERKHLEYAIAEAVWMSLENQTYFSADLVSQLSEFYKGGAKGRANPQVLTLAHYISSLADDVERVDEELEYARISAMEDENEPAY